MDSHSSKKQSLNGEYVEAILLTCLEISPSFFINKTDDMMIICKKIQSFLPPQYHKIGRDLQKDKRKLFETIFSNFSNFSLMEDLDFLKIDITLEKKEDIDFLPGACFNVEKKILNLCAGYCLARDSYELTIDNVTVTIKSTLISLSESGYKTALSIRDNRNSYLRFEQQKLFNSEAVKAAKSSAITARIALLVGVVLAICSVLNMLHNIGFLKVR